jgi:hypothetical protein
LVPARWPLPRGQHGMTHRKEVVMTNEEFIESREAGESATKW